MYGYVAALSALMVPFVSLLKKEHWPNQVKFLISIVLALAISVVVVVVKFHVHTLAGFIPNAGLALGTMQLVYQMYFKGSEWDETLTAFSFLHKHADLVQEGVQVAEAVVAQVDPKVAAAANTVATQLSLIPEPTSTQ